MALELADGVGVGCRDAGKGDGSWDLNIHVSEDRSCTKRALCTDRQDRARRQTGGGGAELM